MKFKLTRGHDQKKWRFMRLEISRHDNRKSIILAIRSYFFNLVLFYILVKVIFSVLNIIIFNFINNYKNIEKRVELFLKSQYVLWINL